MDGLHVMPLSHEVIAVWRLLFWLAAVLVVGQLLSDALGRGGLLSTRLGRAALIVLITRFAIVQALRWNGPAYWEGLPLETIGLALAAASAWAYKRANEDEARESTGVPRRF